MLAYLVGLVRDSLNFFRDCYLMALDTHYFLIRTSTSAQLVNLLLNL